MYIDQLVAERETSRQSQLVAEYETLRQSQAESSTTKQQQELAEKAQEIKTLKNQLKQNIDQIQILNQNVENLKKENDKLNLENMAIKMNFKSLQTALAESKSNIEALKSEIGFKDTEKYDLQSKLYQVTAQLKEAQAALQSHATVQLQSKPEEPRSVASVSSNDTTISTNKETSPILTRNTTIPISRSDPNPLRVETSLNRRPVEETLPISAEAYNCNSSNKYRRYDHASKAAFRTSGLVPPPAKIALHTASSTKSAGHIGKSKRTRELRTFVNSSNLSPVLDSKPIVLPYINPDDIASDSTPMTTSAPATSTKLATPVTAFKPQKRRLSHESSASISDSEDSELRPKKSKQ